MTLEDFFTLTEMKDGLTVPSRVEELLNVMQKEKDCVVKNVGDGTRQWAAVASTIASTENKDCLDLFIQLDELWFIDRWLKDAQKFGKDTSDSCVEESITALLQALEKLHIDNERSISSGILITVMNLLGHDSSKVQDQDRARMLFDSWQHGKDCDSIPQDVDDVNRRLAEEDCGQSALGALEISSASGALESGAACTGDEAGSEKKIVREPALQNSVDANEKPASDFKSRLADMRVINRCSANALKTTGQDDECCSNALLSANGISGKPEDLDTTFSTMEDIGEGDEDKEHTSDEGDDFMKASDFPKSATHTKNPDAIDKRRSDIENEYGMVDALEVTRQVAQEVGREIVDCREPFCSSSSEKISEGGIREPGGPDSINGMQDRPTDVPQEEVPTGQSHSAETNPEGEGGSINSDNLDNEPENSTHDMASSRVTEVAQEPEGNIEKGPCDFDLNQEVCSDGMDCLINLLTPISFVSASKPAAAPGLPVATLQFEGSLAWKGCAATSAFRPAYLSTGGARDSSKQIWWTTISFSSAMYGPTGSIPYMVDSRCASDYGFCTSCSAFLPTAAFRYCYWFPLNFIILNPTPYSIIKFGRSLKQQQVLDLRTPIISSWPTKEYTKM